MGIDIGVRYLDKKEDRNKFIKLIFLQNMYNHVMAPHRKLFSEAEANTIPYSIDDVYKEYIRLWHELFDDPQIPKDDIVESFVGSTWKYLNIWTFSLPYRRKLEVKIDYYFSEQLKDLLLLYEDATKIDKKYQSNVDFISALIKNKCVLYPC